MVTRFLAPLLHRRAGAPAVSMNWYGEVPHLADFAPLQESIRLQAFVALSVAFADGAVEIYRNASGWQVWIFGKGPHDSGYRLPLADWATQWAARTALAESEARG